jgi:hypothetical protein
MLMPEDFGRSDHPVRSITRRLRDIFIDVASTPPLRGGELLCTFSILLFSIILFLVLPQHTDAHKPVTSKYDYNRDVFPLLRDHCASCHVEGGPGPMSLMTYGEAVPWAESIRDEVTAGRMPPWPVDSTSPAVKGGHPISSRDLDIIAVWASGGTPQGDPDAKLPMITFKSQWKLGQPDLRIPMDAEYMMGPGKLEETREFSLAANVTGTKWIKAVDLMPGNASIVRDAVISIEKGPVLTLWEPGSDITPAPSGVAFRMEAGSKLHLQIHYKKHFDQEQNTVSDKSAIGLYFTDPPNSGREIQSLVLNSPALAGKLLGAARIVALRPMLDRGYESLNIEATTPSGSHVVLLRLHGPRPQWFQRYWLQEPVELPSGSEIKATASPLSDYSDEPKTSRTFPLAVALDYVPQ